MKFLVSAVLLLSLEAPSWAMHIMEGFLPAGWAVLWWGLYLPLLFYGLRRIGSMVQRDPANKLLLGFVGAFVFVLSALKLPSVTGSSSHPTGTGLGAALFGPAPMFVLGFVVLLFQALFLAHGGLTTLGANSFSMAFFGPVCGWLAYRFSRRAGASAFVGMFLAGAVSDLLTYVMTSLQLALAFPAAEGGVWASFYRFMGIFAITQVPLALVEGVLCALVFRVLESSIPALVDQLQGVN